MVPNVVLTRVGSLGPRYSVVTTALVTRRMRDSPGEVRMESTRETCSPQRPMGAARQRGQAGDDSRSSALRLDHVSRVDAAQRDVDAPLSNQPPKSTEHGRQRASGRHVGSREQIVVHVDVHPRVTGEADPPTCCPP